MESLVRYPKTPLSYLVYEYLQRMEKLIIMSAVRYVDQSVTNTSNCRVVDQGRQYKIEPL